MYKMIYEDDNWTIEIIDDKIRITLFKDNHFVDDLELTRTAFEDNEIK